MTKRANWMREANWGAFIHFLASPPSSVSNQRLSIEEWNATVDAFDTEGLARQLEEARAKYLYLTLGQCSGFFCAPNATYSRITGSNRCSRRDLILDMYDSLSKRGIKLLAYLPSHGPSQDSEAMYRLKFIPPWNCALWNPSEEISSADASIRFDKRVTEGQRNWEAVIREWSQRWGNKVGGWWFDGCYYADIMYRHQDEPNFTSFANAARFGNPQSIVAWNPGVVYPPVEMGSEEDYTAGEVNDPRRLDHEDCWQGREQYHILTYLGQYWGKGPTRFTAKEAAAIIGETNNYGGPVTWDLPIQRNGLVQQDAFDVLCGIEDELLNMNMHAFHEKHP